MFKFFTRRRTTRIHLYIVYIYRINNNYKNQLIEVVSVYYFIRIIVYGMLL